MKSWPNFAKLSENSRFQLERYLRKLDMELQKFKLELEADNAGITERLEKSKVWTCHRKVAVIGEASSLSVAGEHAILNFKMMLTSYAEFVSTTVIIFACARNARI